MEIKLKCSFLLYSKLKSTDWVIIDLKGYGPGFGSGYPASFHLSFCPFLEKLRNAEVWMVNTDTSAHNFFRRYVGHGKLLLLCHLRQAGKPVGIYLPAQCGST